MEVRETGPGGPLLLHRVPGGVEGGGQRGVGAARLRPGHKATAPPGVLQRRQGPAVRAGGRAGRVGRGDQLPQLQLLRRHGDRQLLQGLHAARRPAAARHVLRPIRLRHLTGTSRVLSLISIN